MKQYKLTLDAKLARAAGWDAANANMRKNGRRSWNEDDYQVAVETFSRIWPEACDAEDPRDARAH